MIENMPTPQMSLITLLYRERKLTPDQQSKEITYRYCQQTLNEKTEAVTKRIADLPLEVFRSLVFSKEHTFDGYIYVLTPKPTTVDYTGTLIYYFNLPNDKNIFKSPTAVVVEDRDGIITALDIDSPTTEPLQFPKSCVNTGEPHEGKLYFDDFFEVIDYAMYHDL